jgi:hypothetical protein
MKIRPQVLIMGLATLLFAAANFFELFRGYFYDGWYFGLDFYSISMILSPVIEIAALVGATLFFNKKVFRFAGLSLFIIVRIFYGIYVLSLYGDLPGSQTVRLFLEYVLAIPSMLFGIVYTIFVIMELLALLLIIGANVWDLISPNQSLSNSNRKFSPPPPPQTQVSYQPPSFSENKPNNFAPPPSPTIGKIESNLANDDYAQIERFGDLLNKGLITQEEFELKKKRILGI